MSVTAWIPVVLLVAQLLTPYSPEMVKEFEAIPIGETRDVAFPQGDGCNSCTCPVHRTSETHIKVGNSCRCTLVNCRPLFSPEIPFK